jgi:3'(2'), 5'-bisphosphate nucleotidase
MPRLGIHLDQITGLDHLCDALLQPATHSADLLSSSVPGKSAPKDWDFAASEIVLTEAGGKFTQLDGSPLRYNESDVS